MKHTKKLLSLLLVLCLILSLSCTAFAADEAKPLTGKTVILHSNDVHGAIDLYAAMASLKTDYEAQGAEVILADAGDYSQGTVYVSVNKGADAVTMMNATGYDVATIGNHEFDYGYAQLAENMKAAKFKVLCADVLGADGKTIFDANTIIEKGGVKIGFFGLETPEAQTKANPKLIQGLKFLAGKDGKELYACATEQVNDLKAQGADIVICLAHLGTDGSSEPYTSYDLAANVKGIDFIIVRELIGGVYFGNHETHTLENGEKQAIDSMPYSEHEIERIGRIGFETAQKRRKKLCCVDKANVLDTSRLWRSVMHRLQAEYPDVEYSEMFVDNCAMQIVKNPAQFDVIVTENMFGDILSDEASMITGSIGMIPSSSLGDGTRGLYEPIHGSAPDIAGKDIVNPTACILSAAMMLRYSFGMTEEADAIENAVNKVLDKGLRTADNMSEGCTCLGCTAMGDAILAEI